MWVCIWRTLTTEQFFFRKDSKLFRSSYMKYVFSASDSARHVSVLILPFLTSDWLQRITGFLYQFKRNRNRNRNVAPQ